MFTSVKDTSNQGAIVGRVANRIENARFEIDGKIYLLADNDNGNCLHGGVGFQHRLWKVVNYTENSITLSYLSPDGEDGFPANLQIDVSYTLKDAAIIISYTATPDGKTPIALTNHAFFNLDGFGGDITEHTVQIWADSYSEVNDKLIPTGNHPNVIGTPLDLRLSKKVGEDFSPTFDGYDGFYSYACFVVKSSSRALFLPSSLISPALVRAIFVRKGPTIS